MDWKLELVGIPVSDVDRAKAFYTDKVGFHADHDHRVTEQIRFVQLTPPGSACSIALGEGIVEGAPGSVKGLQMVVADVKAARASWSSGGWRSATSRTSRGARSPSSATRTATAGPCRSYPPGADPGGAAAAAASCARATASLRSVRGRVG